MSNNAPHTSFYGYLSRYAGSTAGLAFVTLGIAISIICNLGTAPLSCPSYLLSLWGPLTVGQFNIIINTSLIIIQLAVLRKRFKVKYLQQIIASIILGYMIDFWMWALGGINPGSYLERLTLVLLGCLLTALGVSMELKAEAWMLSAEMTVYAFTKVIDKPFGTIKIWMDSIYVLLSAAICLVIYKNPFGTGTYTGLKDVLTATMPGIVIGAGTLLQAILPGYLMKFTNPVVVRMSGGTGKWINTASDNQ